MLLETGLGHFRQCPKAPTRSIWVLWAVVFLIVQRQHLRLLTKYKLELLQALLQLTEMAMMLTLLRSHEQLAPLRCWRWLGEFDYSCG